MASAKTDEALPGLKLITPLISMDKYNSWREDQMCSLYGKIYFQNCINNYIELKSSGMSHISILVLSFSSLGNKGTGEFDLLIFITVKRFIWVPHFPQKIIFGIKWKVILRFPVSVHGLIT